MKQTILSSKQSELLENLTIKYGQVVTTKQICKQVEKIWDSAYGKKTITKLVKNGWLIRIKRGTYALSDFNNRGFLSLSPYLVANLLVEKSYVSFEAALSYYGMFDQLTEKVVSVSQRQYKTVKLGSLKYSFVKAKNKSFFGWQTKIIENSNVRIATPEKSLIDIVQFHKSKYSLDVVIEKLSCYSTKLDFKKLNQYLERMSLTTIKIFGFVFDTLGINSTALYKLIRAKRGTHWMFPKDKKFNSKWRLYYDSYFDKYKSIK